jgi:hypothetical protein
MFTDGINGIIRSFNSLAEVIGVSIDEIDFTPMTVDAPKSFQDRWAEGTAEVRQSFGRVGEHVIGYADGHCRRDGQNDFGNTNNSRICFASG